MKRYKILLPLLTAVVALGAGTTWFVTRVPASPFDGETARAIPAPLVERGAYVARLADCVACHAVPGGAPFSGGHAMATPLGAIFGTNITPDAETGIGHYSLADFDRALRRGVARDGRRLYPAMPYPSYAKVSDEDVRALYAYFMKGVRPAHQPNRQSTIPWPLNMRWPLALWNAVFSTTKTFTPQPARDAAWNRGAYLVESLGHCGACHTPRGLAMNEKALDGSDARFLSGALIDGWYAPSLRGDDNHGLARWSEGDIHQFLKTGRNSHGVVFGSMSDAFNNSTQFMTDADLMAIAHYLKSLPGDGDTLAWHDDPASAKALAIANQVNSPAAQIYAARCSFCHGNDGRGKAPWIPPLGGSASTTGPEGASAINITLNGSPRVVTGGMVDSYRMPAYRHQLSDDQIAAVVSFVRKSWGNQGDAVKAGDVKTLRDKTEAAGPVPTVLRVD
jgi:mono/diheme cytochrome c family protein